MTSYIVISILVFCAGWIISMRLSYSTAQLTQVLRVIYPSSKQEVNSNAPEQLIGQIIEFLEQARREGILALESDPAVHNLQDRFFRSGLLMALDGVEPGFIRETLTIRMKAMKSHQENAKITLLAAGHLALMIGGVVFFLFTLLVSLFDTPSFSLQQIFSAACATPLLSVLMYVFIVIPLIKRLEESIRQDVLMRDLALTGVLSIQAGDNPRLVEQRLWGYLHESLYVEREDEEIRKRISSCQSLAETVIDDEPFEEVGDVTGSDLQPDPSVEHFTFADIAGLENRAIQTVIQHIDFNLLTTAMIKMPDDFKEKIHQNVSSRRAQMMREQEELNAELEDDSILKCQSKVVEAILQLDDSGEIIIQSESDLQ